MRNINQKIIDILEEIQPGFDFSEGVDFIAEGYLDSFDVVALVAQLESDFSIIISALEIVPENFTSVENIARLVEKSPRKTS